MWKDGHEKQCQRRDLIGISILVLQPEKDKKPWVDTMMPLLHGLWVEAKKLNNMSKITMTIQKPDETPTDFYERLCEAFRTDTETAKNQRMTNAAFVAQSYADIQWKLQELEGFTGMSATQLLEVANKVSVNQDREAQQEAGRSETESGPAG